MGRGRAKAKQTKVARRLKYYSPDTDLTALERELKGNEGEIPMSYVSPAPDEKQGMHSTENYRQPSLHGEDKSAVNGTHRTTEGQARPSPPAPGSWMKKPR